jgi:RimJ/RimL family protein N-acetyltransferase
MRAPQQQKLPRREVRIDCGDYLLRTLKVDDASDRWAGWMTDPRNMRLLNLPPRAMTRADIAGYIGQFDQRSSLLIGIFEQQTRDHIGFFRVDISPTRSRCLCFMFLGEDKYRSHRVTGALAVPFQDFIFETLGISTMLGTVLARNRPMIFYLLKYGWVLDRTADRHVKSQADGSMLDLCFLSLSRDGWRAWKQANLPPK